MARIGDQAREIALQDRRLAEDIEAADDFVERRFVGDEQAVADGHHAVRRRDRSDVAGVGLQRGEPRLDIGRRVRDRKPADDLVQRRLVGFERRHIGRDRAVQRGDRTDVARIGGETREVALQDRRLAEDIEAADDLVERRRVGDEQAVADRHHAARRRNRREMASIALQRRQIGLDVRRRVGNREPASNPVERRPDIQEGGNRLGDPTVRHAR